MNKKSLFAVWAAIGLTMAGSAHASRPCRQSDISPEPRTYMMADIDYVQGDQYEVAVGMKVFGHHYTFHYPNPAYRYAYGPTLISFDKDKKNVVVFGNNPPEVMRTFGTGNDEYCFINVWTVTHK